MVQRIDYMDLQKEVGPPKLSTSLKGICFSLLAMVVVGYLGICAWAVFGNTNQHVKTIDLSKIQTPDDLIKNCVDNDMIGECECAISYYIDYILGKDKK